MKRLTWNLVTRRSDCMMLHLKFMQIASVFAWDLIVTFNAQSVKWLLVLKCYKLYSHCISWENAFIWLGYAFCLLSSILVNNNRISSKALRGIDFLSLVFCSAWIADAEHSEELRTTNAVCATESAVKNNDCKQFITKMFLL